MKCSACQKNLCEKKYENRHKCVGTKESIKCTCTCQVSVTEEIVSSLLSFGAGAGAVAGGVAITVMTGGLGYLFGGGALIGAGSSLIMNPIQKQITGEHMTLKDTAQDVALGATIGAITGPIGSGLSGVAKGASGLVKFGVRAGAGAIAGGVSGTVSETAKVLRGEEVSIASYSKAIGIGALAGTVGGASTHLGSNLSKGVSSGAAKACTRVAVQATAGMATDAGLQLIDKGEIDTKQLILNTVGQVTVATTAEVSHNMSKRTNAYGKNVNSEMIDDKLKSDEQNIKAKLNNAAKQVNALPSDVTDKMVEMAHEYNNVKEQLIEQKAHQENLNKISQDSSLDPRAKQEAKQNYVKQNNLPQKNTQKQINRKINNLNKRAGEVRPQKIGEHNVHALLGDRAGQVAVDIARPDIETGERSAERVILEKHGEQWVYADHTLEHDYGPLDRDVKSKIPDRFDALRPEQLIRGCIDDDTDDHEKKE